MVCHIFYAVTVHQQTTFNTLAAVLLSSLAKAGGLLERQRKNKEKKSQTNSQIHAQVICNQPLYRKKIPPYTILTY